MSIKDSRTGQLPYSISNKNHLYLYSESLEEKYLWAIPDFLNNTNEVSILKNS